MRADLLKVSLRVSDEQLHAAVARHLDSQPLLPAWRVELVVDGTPADVVMVDQRAWDAVAGGNGSSADLELTAEFASLTCREREVIELVAAGHTNDKVAEAMHVTCATVKTHMRSILRKTCCANRAQLIAWVHGRTPPPDALTHSDVQPQG